ncbi:MAG: methyltransferase [Osedax symbiont Rs2]|nr:MAG: methyltransferase [Osedax symbiont Rs2]
MDYIKTNKKSWDKRTEIHISSKFYDVEGFLNGKNALQEIELNELGDVSGKSLLHLQCHFGLDTLSWARLGANVTGVDLSSTAIAKAKSLSAQAGLNSHFICSDVYSFGERSQEKYDIVFVSYGALCWLPDIDKWANVVANSLKPGGTFYIAEFHPFYDILSGYSYFHNLEPDIEEEGTYTENDTGEKSTLITWAHPLSEVLNALIAAGIQITRLNEYPYSPYNCFEAMLEREKGKFYLSHKEQDIPLVYTIKGIKHA